MPSVQALTALFWGNPAWQRFFRDDVGEVRRSFISLAVNLALMMLVASFAGSDSPVGILGALLLAVSRLAATACFLTIFAVFSMRLGYDSGLCRVIAGLNWAWMLLSIVTEFTVFVTLILVSEEAMQAVAVLMFIWINLVMFRIVKQGLNATTGLAIAAIAVHLLLSVTFAIAAINVQFGANPAALTEGP